MSRIVKEYLLESADVDHDWWRPEEIVVIMKLLLDLRRYASAAEGLEK